MNKVEKHLEKLPTKKRKVLREKIKEILTQKNISGDVKKLRGKRNLYRLRIGDIRIIYEKTKGKSRIVDINDRGSISYEKA